MTTYPNPSPSYYPQPVVQPQPPGTRPGSVTALAIIGIIFGGLGVLCKPASIGMMYMPLPGPNPAIDVQKQFMAWTLFNAGLGTVISVVLLASSIGSLTLKPWARKGMLAYAAAAIVMNVVVLVVGIVWILPRMLEAQQQLINQQQRARGNVPPAQMASIMQTAGTVTTVLTFLVTMIFPLVLWYFYTRPNVVGAFEGGTGGPPPAGPYGGPYGGYPAAPAPGGYYTPPPPGYPQQ